MRRTYVTRLRRPGPLRRGMVAAAACAAVLVATTGAPVQATTPPGGDHQRVLDAMRLITNDVSTGHGSDQIPGMIVRTEVDGVQWTGSVDNHAAPATRQVDAKFRAASNTKMFTAVVIMQLVHEQKLKLTDDVYSILGPILNANGRQGCRLFGPCFAPSTDPAKQITVQNLLNMSSGVADYLSDLSFQANAAVTFPNTSYPNPADLVAEGAVNGPQFAPGKGMEYSNTNYALLGLIIAAKTNMSWEDALTERVINRIGLTNTTLPRNGDPVLPAPHDAHWTNFLKQRIGGVWLGRPAGDQNVTYTYGTGALVSTTGDLLKFMKALLTTETLLPSTFRDRMIAEASFNTNPAGIKVPELGCARTDRWQECIPNPALSNVQSPNDATAPTNWYADPSWKIGIAEYGLGITKRTLTCGDGSKQVLYGHNGGLPGSKTYTYSNADATHMISWNQNGDWEMWELYNQYGVLAAEFCPAA
ncbi:serine hydrolase domain-containing protein [Embleya sp. NPDC050493]|uniref:serine hydrolase domain-containing protein n=1 Tax=Embleya sp. NPDC050493 TaxID=3363989 RepID=UPI0037960D1A